jgi:hypothetical protein
MFGTDYVNISIGLMTFACVTYHFGKSEHSFLPSAYPFGGFFLYRGDPTRESTQVLSVDQMTRGVDTDFSGFNFLYSRF